MTIPKNEELDKIFGSKKTEKDDFDIFSSEKVKKEDIIPEYDEPGSSSEIIEDEIDEDEDQNDEIDNESDDDEDEDEDGMISIDLEPPKRKRGRPRKSGNRPTAPRSTPGIRSAKRKIGRILEERDKIHKDLLSKIPDMEEDLTEVERLLLDIRDRGDNDFWHWSVHRTAPIQTQTGKKCEGFIANFPVSYDLSNIEQILSRHYGGEKYKVSLRNKGTIHASINLPIPGPPRIPDPKVLDRYFDEEGGSVKKDSEREDLIRENSSLQAELRSMRDKIESENLNENIKDMFRNMQDQITRLSDKVNQPKNQSISAEGIAAVITAASGLLAPIGKGILETLGSKNNNNESSELQKQIQELKDTMTENQIANAIKAIGEKKEDPFMQKIMSALITKAINQSDPATKALEETLPKMVKNFAQIAMERSSGGEDSGELTAKDILTTARDVLTSPGLFGGGQRMQIPMNPTMMQQMPMHRMIPQQNVPQQLHQGAQNQPGFRQPDGQEAKTQNIQQDDQQSPKQPSIFLAPEIQEKALEYIQTGRSGSDFASMMDSANDNGQYFSPQLGDMMATFSVGDCKQTILQYLANTGDPLSSELLRSIQTSQGDKFVKEMVEYFKS